MNLGRISRGKIFHSVLISPDIIIVITLSLLFADCLVCAKARGGTKYMTVVRRYQVAVLACENPLPASSEHPCAPFYQSSRQNCCCAFSGLLSEVGKSVNHFHLRSQGAEYLTVFTTHSHTLQLILRLLCWWIDLFSISVLCPDRSSLF